MFTSCMLLRETLALFRDAPDIVAGPEHQTARDALVLRIETCLADSEARSAHPAIALARERWNAVSFLRVDPEERRIEVVADGVWVRGWIKVDYPATDDMRHQITERYERAIAALPTLTGQIFIAHRIDGLDYAAVGDRFGLSEGEIERRIVDALTAIAKAVRDQ